MTVGLRVTLVHELTDALQDQHFELGRLYDSRLDDGAATAFRALIEGDALRIEHEYVTNELTPNEKASYDEEYAIALADSKVSTHDVPPYVSASFGVPYLLGQPLVTMIANDGGNAAVDRAFASPRTPRSTSSIRPAFLPMTRGGRSISGSARAPRCSTTARSAARSGTSCSPSGSTRSRRSTPRSAGVATPTPCSTAPSAPASGRGSWAIRPPMTTRCGRRWPRAFLLAGARRSLPELLELAI